MLLIDGFYIILVFEIRQVFGCRKCPIIIFCLNLMRLLSSETTNSNRRRRGAVLPRNSEYRGSPFPSLLYIFL